MRTETFCNFLKTKSGGYKNMIPAQHWNIFSHLDKENGGAKKKKNCFFWAVFSNFATFSHSEPEVIIKRKYPNKDLRHPKKRNFRKSKEFFPCGSLILKHFKIQELQVISKMKYPPNTETKTYVTLKKERNVFFFKTFAPCCAGFFLKKI